MIQFSRPSFQGTILNRFSELGATYIKFGEEIGPLSALSNHLLDLKTRDNKIGLRVEI